MTQADRVLSTPPTNTPTDTKRRRFLSVAAAGAVAVIAPTVSARAADSLPASQGIDAVRRIRDDIEQRVKTLIAELEPTTSRGDRSR